MLVANDAFLDRIFGQLPVYPAEGTRGEDAVQTVQGYFAHFSQQRVMDTLLFNLLLANELACALLETRHSASRRTPACPSPAGASVVCAIIEKRMEHPKKVQFLAQMRLLERLQASGLQDKERSAEIVGTFAEELCDTSGGPEFCWKARKFREGIDRPSCRG